MELKMRNNIIRKFNLIIKRVIDLIGSVIGLVILAPLNIFIAIAIKLTSKGPVLYRQERLGKDGKTFFIFKFRTMVIDADKIGDGLFVKTEFDTRITTIGKLLRATSLDELPQLLNVLIGEMSLVGPRPPVPFHPHKYNEYSAFQKRRFEMRPGITGLTQVTVRNSVPWDERIKVDVKYNEKFNVLLDINILIRTIFKIFQRESIYTHTKKNQ